MFLYLLVDLFEYLRLRDIAVYLYAEQVKTARDALEGLPDYVGRF